MFGRSTKNQKQKRYRNGPYLLISLELVIKITCISLRRRNKKIIKKYPKVTIYVLRCNAKNKMGRRGKSEN